MQKTGNCWITTTSNKHFLGIKRKCKWETRFQRHNLNKFCAIASKGFLIVTKSNINYLKSAWKRDNSQRHKTIKHIFWSQLHSVTGWFRRIYDVPMRSWWYYLSFFWNLCILSTWNPWNVTKKNIRVLRKKGWYMILRR